MSALSKQLGKGEILFREGDPSDACYVVKTGKIAITKTKGNSEIELATLGPGQMFGEMAFFDSKPRSAGAKASVDTTVIILPFSSLNQQFQGFPQWLKAMVKTINDNLREANKRIKNLEQASKGEDRVFPPHTITKLTSILTLVANRYGEKQPDGSVILDGNRLRNYTIQVFQEPTHKMQKINDIFQSLGYLKVEDMGEGRSRIVMTHLDLLTNFADFYNKWLFTEESKRVLIQQPDLRLLKALIHYGKGNPPDAKTGKTKVSLTQIQNESMRDLNYLVQINQWSDLIEKGLISEQMSEAGGVIAVQCDLNELQRILPYWEIIYAIESQDRR